MRNEIANFRDCKSIAIMGGTFDPIHHGHLVTAEAVRYRFKVDKVVFMPAGQPAHKTNKKVTHNEHRYLMTVLATMRNENFEVSRIEIDRAGVTYTIDTIEEGYMTKDLAMITTLPEVHVLNSEEFIKAIAERL